MNPDVQKVLDFIREGAKAASGPAKWGFEQVCAYRAVVAIATIIGLVIALFVVGGITMYLINKYLNPQGIRRTFTGSWWEAPAHLEHRWANCDHQEIKTIEYYDHQKDGLGLAAIVGVIFSAFLLIGLIVEGPNLVATAVNPAGSVLNSLLPGGSN